LHADETFLDELPLTARGRGVGSSDDTIKLVEISLSDRAGALRVCIAEGETDHATFFVIHDHSVTRDILYGIDALTLAIYLLQIETIDEMVTDGAAVEEVDEESAGGSTAQQTAGKATQPAQPAQRTAGERGEHGSA